MAISGVYEIVNKVNDHRYIGSSVNIRGRWSGHTSDLNKNRHHSAYLQRAWNKYGPDSFEFRIIERCKKAELIDREQHHMDLHKPVYNTFPFARSCLGVSQSPEARRKISRAKLGNSHATEYMQSAEARAKYSEIHKGKIVSAETRAKISAVQLGRVASDKTRSKMSDARRGEKNPTSKLTWEQVEEIRERYVPRKVSQRALAKEFGVDQQVIWAIVNHKTWKAR